MHNAKAGSSGDRRLAKLTVCAAGAAATLFGSGGQALADGPVSYNWGACMTQTPPELHPLLAPGQLDVAPLTVVDGQVVRYPGRQFAGGMGCSR